MIVLDGRMGEGGGQVLRSSLALSALTGQPFRLEHVRGNRSRPGLAAQHLCSVRAAAEVCRAQVEGDALGSSTLTFRPMTLRGGHYRFDIGTAGSTALVLQTILLPLLAAPEPADVVITGGTHAIKAPTAHFLDEVYLPLLRRMGAKVELTVDRMGFFPKGGGKLRVRTEPSELRPLELLDRGEAAMPEVLAIVSDLPDHVAEREIRTACLALQIPRRQGSIVRVDRPRGPGNSVIVRLPAEHLTEHATAHGRKGLRAERVAEEAAGEARTLLDADVPVGEHLCDQLMLPAALAGGGTWRTTEPSLHSTTHADVLRTFLGTEVRFEAEDAVRTRVEVTGERLAAR